MRRRIRKRRRREPKKARKSRKRDTREVANRISAEQRRRLPGLRRKLLLRQTRL